jgi:hypothetical protein
MPPSNVRQRLNVSEEIGEKKSIGEPVEYQQLGALYDKYVGSRVTGLGEF